MKKRKVLFACLISGILLIAAALCTGCSANMYSEERHIQKIRARAEARYLGEGSEYTGLEVYPIYNEYDELKYALIDFEPQGFIYVVINDKAYPWRGMYTICTKKPETGWWPYRVKEGAREDVIDENGNVIAQTVNQEFFRDENGLVITYNESHFKVAGIKDERRYFLSAELTVFLGRERGLIPAVKRGEQYLNLVDGAMINYTPGMKSAYSVVNIDFINKGDFDL